MLNYGQDTHANVAFANLFKIYKTKSIIIKWSSEQLRQPHLVVIKLHLLETFLKCDVFCELGRSTPLRKCVFTCTCVILVFYNGEDGPE